MVRPLWLDAYLLYLPGPVFLLPILVLLLSARGTKASIFRLFTACLLTFNWLLPLRLNLKESPGPYRLVTLNIQSQDTNVVQAIVQLRELDPDFICLQEIWQRPELEIATKYLPNYKLLGAATDEYKRKNFNEGTFLAVREDWSVDQLSLKEESALAKVSRGNNKLVVVSVHAPRSKSFYPAGLKETVQEQTQKGEELMNELANFTAPCLVAGDFNAPEGGPALKLLDNRFHYAFHQAGSGFGLSFPSKFPFVRIDHVLGTSQIKFTDFETRDFGSDHLGIIVDFEVSH